MVPCVVQFLRQEVGRARGSVRQHGHSHGHGGDEGAGQPEQQLHRQQEERQAEAQPAAGGGCRRVSHQRAEGERLLLLLHSNYTRCVWGWGRTTRQQNTRFLELLLIYTVLVCIHVVLSFRYLARLKDLIPLDSLWGGKVKVLTWVKWHFAALTLHRRRKCDVWRCPAHSQDEFTFLYLWIWSVAVFQLESTVMPYLSVLSDFRERVRKIAREQKG